MRERERKIFSALNQPVRLKILTPFLFYEREGNIRVMR